MTKHHMNRAAEMVKAILDGEWTNEPPTWAMSLVSHEMTDIAPGVRAIQTAEAFIMLFKAFNDRFDEQRFLIACGLAETTKKGRK